MVEVDEECYKSQVKHDHNTSKSPNTFIPISKVEPIKVDANPNCLSPTTKLFSDDWGSLYFMPHFNKESKISPSKYKNS